MATSRNARCRASIARRRSTRSGRARATSCASTSSERFDASRMPSTRCLRSLQAGANCLIEVPRFSANVARGTSISILPLTGLLGW